MKLGVSYNLFDGFELLEGSIKQIRDQVDYISVVYQTKSNFGNDCNPELIPLLQRLVAEGLVNELFEYQPKVDRGGHFNELKKRNIGLSLSVGAGCTHHMSMDSDEYYFPIEFERLKKTIIDGDYDSSYCQMLSYYKTSDYILNPPEDYYVSLIFKIKDESNFGAVGAPVVVDPTRNLSPSNKPIIFKREEVQMHHMSFVRKDLFSKLINSSANASFLHIIPKIVKYYENWQFPNQVMWASGQLLNVKKTENGFNIKF